MRFRCLGYSQEEVRKQACPNKRVACCICHLRLSWKAGEMMVIRVTKVKQNKIIIKQNKTRYNNNVNSIVHGCVLCHCRDTLNCSEHQQMCPKAIEASGFFYLCVYLLCRTNSVHTTTYCTGPCSYTSGLRHRMSLI